MKIMDEARRLISEYVHINEFEKLGEGWDSTTYLVNGTDVFRMPKRQAVASLMFHEVRVLELVNVHVSLAVPNVTLIVPPANGFSTSFVRYPIVKGIPISERLMTSTRFSESVLQAVGQFLTELHAIPRDELASSHVEWFRWTGEPEASSASGWEAGLRSFIERIQNFVYPLLSADVKRTVHADFERFLENPCHFTFQPVLIHGDLSDEHILVSGETGQVVGVIDFGDSGLGDPAYDVAFEVAPFYHGSTDDTFSERQRFYRQLSPFHGALFGLEVGDDMMVASSVKQISRYFVPGGFA